MICEGSLDTWMTSIATMLWAVLVIGTCCLVKQVPPLTVNLTSILILYCHLYLGFPCIKLETCINIVNWMGRFQFIQFFVRLKVIIFCFASSDKSGYASWPVAEGWGVSRDWEVTSVHGPETSKSGCRQKRYQVMLSRQGTTASSFFCVAINVRMYVYKSTSVDGLIYRLHMFSSCCIDSEHDWLIWKVRENYCILLGSTYQPPVWPLLGYGLIFASPQILVSTLLFIYMFLSLIIPCTEFLYNPF